MALTFQAQALASACRVIEMLLTERKGVWAN